MPDTKTDALNFIRREGPIQPSQLASELNTNILFASAILSELVSNKHSKITSVKKGGSPFYYIKGQEPKLESLQEFLGGKPKEAFELLRGKKIIRDKSSEPWQRVAFKELKDFAVPLNVGLGGEYELFWKWYLTTNDEAKEIIKDIIKPSKKKVVKKEVEKKIEKPMKEAVKEKLTRPVPQEISQELDGVPDIVNSFFSSIQIYVISQETIRKNKEMNFVGDVPSNLGNLRYFVKFKDKKTVSDADLISASDQANANKLPLLFISPGKSTRKAEKYLNDHKSGKLIFRSLN
tara:strand:- start:319 stop:1191 length:873 start_codon:yes stop_codon:yes gene_type:complete